MEESKNKAVEGFALSGEEVEHLTDKHFTIAVEPYYKEFQGDDKTKEPDRKLVIPIRLSGGTHDPENSSPDIEWYANKTSQKVIIAKCGRELKKWIGFKGEFVVKDQVVGKVERKVIYLK